VVSLVSRPTPMFILILKILTRPGDKTRFHYNTPLVEYTYIYTYNITRRSKWNDVSEIWKTPAYKYVEL
jgi:hypothetical protein